MVERFFRDISENRLRRGVFKSVPELVSAIDEYVTHYNTNPKPFIWTKSARDILQKVIRANARLSSKQNGTLHWPVTLRDCLHIEQRHSTQVLAPPQLEVCSSSRRRSEHTIQRRQPHHCRRQWSYP